MTKTIVSLGVDCGVANFLKENGLIKNVNSQVKVLGDGEVNSSINIKVDFYSDSAKSKIEKAGGKADII